MVAPGRVGGGAVLLLHGVRADRRAMLPRSLALQQLGYAVLLMDLPAHGESAGERITYGRDEGASVRHALLWLRTQLPDEKVGVIGASLGGAALVLSNAVPAPDAVVLEAMFPTIEAAVSNRIHTRVGVLSQLLTPLLVWQLPLRLGVDLAQLRPIDQMASLRAPVLVAGGADDMLTTKAETQQLFDAANAPKQLWVVPGAAHVDLYAYAPAEYAAHVFGFLQHHLQK